jgi:hypothetical protein
MIIDFHTHVFPEKIAQSTINALASKSGNKPNTDGTVEGMIKALERANADIAVALPVLTKATQFDSVTRFAIEINNKYANCDRKIISFGGMHPDCENIDEKLKYLSENGIKSIDLMPYHGLTGSKYAAVDREYNPSFNENKPLNYGKEIFEKYGITANIL